MIGVSEMKQTLSRNNQREIEKTKTTPYERLGIEIIVFDTQNIYADIIDASQEDQAPMNPGWLPSFE